MPSPPIQVFLTTIASQPALRQRQEYILRTLQVKKIAFTSYDLASDENAKRLWRRKAPADKQQLPGLLIGGRFPGTFADFEEAVEYRELNSFLRLDEEYDSVIEGDQPLPPAQAIGVPGASSPQQMTNQKPSFAASPSPLRNKGGTRAVEFDMGEELPGFGLQGLKVTDDDLAALVAELGLEGDEAGDLVKGLSNTSQKEPKDSVEAHEKSDTRPTEINEEAQHEETVTPDEEKKSQVPEVETETSQV